MFFRVGIWQTMLQRASFIINPDSYPEGFYLVIVEAPNECQSMNFTEGVLTKEDFGNRKTANISSDKLRITIKENSPTFNYWLGPGVVCLGYLLVFLFSIGIVKCVMDQEINNNFQEENYKEDTNGLKNMQKTILEMPENDKLTVNSEKRLRKRRESVRE